VLLLSLYVFMVWAGSIYFFWNNTNTITNTSTKTNTITITNTSTNTKTNANTNKSTKQTQSQSQTQAQIQKQTQTQTKVQNKHNHNHKHKHKYKNKHNHNHKHKTSLLGTVGRCTKTPVDNICNLRERLEVTVAYCNQIWIFLTRMTKMRYSILFLKLLKRYAANPEGHRSHWIQGGDTKQY